MQIRHIALAVAMAAGSAPAAALALTPPATQVFTIDAAPGNPVATVSYDGSTDFGATSFAFWTGGNGYAFGWTVPGTVNVTGGVATYRLPDVTVEAAPGWVLSGPQTFLGNLQFSESGAGTTSAHLGGALGLNNSLPTPLSASMDKTVTSSVPPASAAGYFSETVAATGPFTRITFSEGVLTLRAASGSGFAAIAAQPQNELRFSFNAVAVPEPGTGVMLLAGLLGVCWVAYRRRPAD